MAVILFVLFLFTHYCHKNGGTDTATCLSGGGGGLADGLSWFLCEHALRLLHVVLFIYFYAYVRFLPNVHVK